MGQEEAALWINGVEVGIPGHLAEAATQKKEVHGKQLCKQPPKEKHLGFFSIPPTLQAPIGPLLLANLSWRQLK